MLRQIIIGKLSNGAEFILDEKTIKQIAKEILAKADK